MVKTGDNATLGNSAAVATDALSHFTPMPNPVVAMIARSFASLLLGQAVADGDLRAVELQQIERILKKTFYLGYSDTKRLVREALNESVEIGSLAFENSLETLRERFLPEQRKRFQEALLEVAKSDGHIDEREDLFSAYVSRRLGIATASAAG